jgi:hypothetical protein
MPEGARSSGRIWVLTFEAFSNCVLVADVVVLCLYAVNLLIQLFLGRFFVTVSLICATL